MTKRIALLMALGLLAVASVGCRHYYGYSRDPYYYGHGTQYYTAPAAPQYVYGGVTYNQVRPYPCYATAPYYYAGTYYYPDGYGAYRAYRSPQYYGHTYPPQHGTTVYRRPTHSATGHRPGPGSHQRPGGGYVAPTPRPPAPSGGSLHVQQTGTSRGRQLVIPVPPLPKPPLLPTHIKNPLKIKK